MKVSIISRVFPPETPTAAEEVKDIVQYLVSKKHEVNVYTTFPNRPIGKVYPGFKRLWVTKSNEYGADVYRTWHTISKKSNFISRILENITFGLTSSRLFSNHDKPDIVYLMSWPLFAMNMISKECIKRNIPYLVNIKDIYPDIILETKKINKFFLLSSYLERIDNSVVSNSKKLIVISNNMKRFYEYRRMIPEKHIDVIYDWQDPDVIKPTEKVGQYRKKLHLTKNNFVALYAGNVGQPQGLEVFLDVAKILENNEEIKILIVGNGSCYEKIFKEVLYRNLKNLLMINDLSRDNVSDVQSAADLLLLPLRPNVGRYALPSKLISYMLTNRPVLASIDVDSEAAYHINQARCGHIVPSMDSKAIAGGILFANNNREYLEEMGRLGREYALSVFSKQESLQKIEDLLVMYSKGK